MPTVTDRSEREEVNPYASPQGGGERRLAREPARTGRRPWRGLVAGLILGPFWGGGAGALAAILIGVVTAAIVAAQYEQPWHTMPGNSPAGMIVLFATFACILGAVYGAATGFLLGPILGLLVTMASRSVTRFVGALVCGLAGAGLGTFAGLVVAGQESPWTKFGFICLGIAMAAVTGGVFGCLLTNVLARIVKSPNPDRN